jgi:hypothetical protein
MVNDLRIYARLAQRTSAAYYRRPAEMRYRYLLRVKKSQVQILSARPNKQALNLCYSTLGGRERRELGTMWRGVVLRRQLTDGQVLPGSTPVSRNCQPALITSCRTASELFGDRGSPA